MEQRTNSAVAGCDYRVKWYPQQVLCTSHAQIHPQPRLREIQFRKLPALRAFFKLLFWQFVEDKIYNCIGLVMQLVV